MIHRIIKLPKKHSFFLFGARGTGKTTLLYQIYQQQSAHFIDLLDVGQETRFIREPELFGRILDELPNNCKTVVIDEVQKVPRLLNVVHRKMEELKRSGRMFQFVMTGSSARKLKRGSENLLAGRAFVFHLFPFTTIELGDRFSLEFSLEFGTLPEVWNLKTRTSMRRFLEAYSLTYLKEEVWAEQLIRNLAPFSHFLEVAAQMNGKVLNFAKIARDIGVDTKTVQSYFQILEDTLLGFFVRPFRRSIRKRQLANPKFYLFDTGVKRALDRTLSVPLLPQTYAFGEAFEHFVILELFRLNTYGNRNYQFFYFQTHDGAEIDLVIDRPGLPLALVEIKSSATIEPGMAKHLITLSQELTPCNAFLLSRDPHAQKIGQVRALPWQDGIKALGL